MAEHPGSGAKPPPRGSVLRFGDCELHVLTHELWRQGRKQPVRRLVFDLMRYLIERRPTPVPHAEIAKAVWGRADVRPSLVAQAVMQARQLTGDVGDEPACFVNVRGVGYRFAAAVTEGAQAGAASEHPDGLDSFEATLADAERASSALDDERAQYLVDRALALASAAGINRQRARALSLASLVAMSRGTLDQAASLATQALQLAESEGHLQLAAEARVRLARVRLAAGDVHGAMACLNAAYGLLDTPDMLQEKRRCERLISLAHRELGQYDDAVAWGNQAQQTWRQLGMTRRALPELTFEVDVYLAQGDALRQQGRAADAQAAFARALALNESLQPDLEASSDKVSKLCWIGNQGVALAGLGRLEEAGKMMDAMAEALQRWPDKVSPAYQRWHLALLGQQADLLAESLRFQEAMDAMQQAVQVAESHGLRGELPALYAMASRVCERAGRPAEALAWMRRHLAAAAAQQSQRAATLATVLQAEVQADTLRRDLQQAREQAAQLALENRALTQRLRQLEQTSLLDEAGFADPLFLQSTLAHRHAACRERDVPLCLALLSISNHASLAAAGDRLSLRAVYQALGRRLADLLPPATPVVHWQPGTFVWALEHMGERRAVAVCAQLTLQLDATAWQAGSDGSALPPPRFGARCIDSARFATLPLALQALGLDSPGGAPT